LVRGERGFEDAADPDEASPRDADPDPPSAPEEVAAVVPDPEKRPDPETASIDPETASVDPETPSEPEPPPVTPSVKSDTIVVCEVIVEIADVTVPIGSTTCAPAAAAPLETPPSASAMKTRPRMTAALIFLPSYRYPLFEQQNSAVKVRIQPGNLEKPA
jgi:hypothetical protein